MRALNKLILFGMILTPLIFTGSTFACFTNTFAYFSDVEYSTGNTLTASVWDNEADHLTVSDSKLTGNGEKLHGITLDVSGTQSVTIDKIQIWWDISQSDTNHITEIKIHGNEFFSGSNSAGEMIDGTDYVLEGGSSAKLEFYFDSDVSNLAPFTINIILGDGSVKSFVTDPKYRSDSPETSMADSEIGSQDSGTSEVDTGLNEQEASVTETEDSQQQEESVDGQDAPVADTEDGQEQEEPVIDTGENEGTPETPEIDAEAESQDEKETDVIDPEEEDQGEQETPITDSEVDQEEVNQEGQEEPLTGEAQDREEESVTDTGENEQDAPAADTEVTDAKDSQEQEESVDEQEVPVTDTGENQDIPETSTIDTEEENQEAQETTLDENL